ncbi:MULTISPECIES: coniferyl-alcohol dehydrogenase [Mycolicibacter]|uniref:Coniferyl-alcohol dehydrogenase n=1 Tax=Mycolicibacter virginiensis TaxID=1795032 RepID=A0A9X7IR67_9MYCO|nr:MULTISPECIES: coniferyl-alcohol dehydrogenase [Mycobacteriaceae]OBG33368.1 3-alpha-hydroxysteroid dehydrogenase [Mycolicibacter heraklionensis]OBJ30513.1 3-alpha-hydroxysteroid dehydrogenase [Mycolicibacter heraklionensis]PQM53579.1 coniferyl-alcohol dehydrogenase [Mycolicibacter virginiensis]
MSAPSGLWRYDGRRAVVTGCASGIGAALVTQLGELGAQVVGLDRVEPAASVDEFHATDLSDPASIDHAAAAIRAAGHVDALFNVAGVSSGIGDPERVVTINFLGLRHLTESLLPAMPAGSAVANVSSLAAAAYRENVQTTVGLLNSQGMAAGLQWCRANPAALADGGYRLSKEAIILYGMLRAEPLAQRGIRINCTAPGVTETPILDQLRGSYGQDFLDDIPKPLGRVASAEEQAAPLVFLNSAAAGYITGQVLWVDGGNISGRAAAALTDGSAPWPA